MNEFKDKLRKHFESPSLSPSQMKKLQSLTSKKRERRSFLKAFALALTCLSIVFIITSQDSLENKIKIEVSKNHSKNAKDYFLTSSLQRLQKELIKINFNLRDHQSLASLTLVGGKYCSIQGNIAAQLKYIDKNNKRYTVYQVDQSNFENLEISNSSFSKKTDVFLYKENGILFAIAHDK